MDNRKILLVNLSKGKTGELNAKLLGMIFVMKIQAAAMSRADIPEEERKDFCLYVDEFQNFATESFESILSEARKFRLNLIVANQFMTQLTDKIREAILGNCGSIICGRIGVTDAEIMEKAFSPVFTGQDLHNQANFHAIATVMMYNMPTSPFTMRLLPAMGDENEELMRRMREYALSRYGRPRAEVEKEIDERLGANEIKKAPAPEGGSAASDGTPAGMPAMPAAPAMGGTATPTTGLATAKQPAPVVSNKPVAQKKSFLDKWMERKAQAAANGGASGDKPAPKPTSMPVQERPASEPEVVPESIPEPTPAPVAKPIAKPIQKPAPKPKPIPESKDEAPEAMPGPKPAPVKKDETRVDIPKSAPTPEPEPEPASEPEPPKPNTISIAGGGQVEQSDDGAILRWR